MLAFSMIECFLSLVLSFGLFGYVDLRVYAYMLVCEKLRVPTCRSTTCNSLALGGFHEPVEAATYMHV